MIRSVVCWFAGVVALGFKRKALTLSGNGLGSQAFLVSMISAILLVTALWALLSSTVSAYEVTYMGHAPNEILLLALLTVTTLALTSTLYALIRKVRQVSAPDLTIGALRSSQWQPSALPLPCQKRAS